MKLEFIFCQSWISGGQFFCVYTSTFQHRHLCILLPHVNKSYECYQHQRRRRYRSALQFRTQYVARSTEKQQKQKQLKCDKLSFGCHLVVVQCTVVYGYKTQQQPLYLTPNLIVFAYVFTHNSYFMAHGCIFFQTTPHLYAKI